MDIFSPVFGNLENGLSSTTKTQEIIAQNIANARTPGYVPKTFDEELNKAVDRTDRKEVNIEEEMADMAENNLKHSALLKLYAGKLSSLRAIVTQGRK